MEARTPMTRALQKLVGLFAAIALVLGLGSALGVATQQAYADTYEGSVYISLSDDGKYVVSDGNIAGAPLAYVEVPLQTVADIRLENWNLEDYYPVDADTGEQDTAVPTALKLDLYLLENYYGEAGDGVALTASGNPGSFFMNHFWGHDCNLLYYVNGTYPLESEGWGATADTIILSAGDFVDIAMFTDWGFYNDSNAGFNYFAESDSDPTDGAITHNYTAAAGVPLTVQVVRGMGDVNVGQDTAYSVADDLNIHYGTAVDPADEGGLSLLEGKATITFTEPGTYYVWADGGVGTDTGQPCQSAAVAIVTVEDHQWTESVTLPTFEADGQIVRTCSVCNSTETQVLPALAFTVTVNGVEIPSSDTAVSVNPTGYDASYTDWQTQELVESHIPLATVTLPAGVAADDSIQIKLNDSFAQYQSYIYDVAQGENGYVGMGFGDETEVGGMPSVVASADTDYAAKVLPAGQVYRIQTVYDANYVSHNLYAIAFQVQEQPAVVVSSANLELEGAIKGNIYLQVPEGIEEGAVAKVSFLGKTADVALTAGEVAIPVESSAKDIASPVTVALEGTQIPLKHNGAAVDSYQTTIRDIALATKEMDDGTGKLVALMDVLINYAHYAQLDVNYTGEYPVAEAEALPPSAETVRAAVATYKATRSGNLPDGAKVAGVAVNNLSATALRVGFTGITEEQVAPGDNIGTETIGNRVWVDAANIKPQDYDVAQTYTVGDFTMTSSVFTWVRSAIKAGADTSSANVACAMYGYCQAAKAYAGV